MSLSLVPQKCSVIENVETLSIDAKKEVESACGLRTSQSSGEVLVCGFGWSQGGPAHRSDRVWRVCGHCCGDLEHHQELQSQQKAARSSRPLVKFLLGDGPLP